MTGRIYLLSGDSDLMAMEEAPYDSEKLLQEMLAKHADLLAGEQIDSDAPRRWLFITREMAVRGEEEGSPRWSLDHLFLDQDAVPTLVEVKKGTNTDIRRKVVGQMLDYAANAVSHWPVEEIRAKFESRCEKSDDDPEEVLSSFLDDDQEPDAYWQQVKANLQAGRIRMIFLADSIPTELRRIVEFLNEQMDPAEVLAIEVKQFVGEGMKTLVPRVFGQTETARQKKATGTKSSNRWDEASFMKALEERKGQDARTAAAELLRWIAPQVTFVWWGHGAKNGGAIPTIKRGETEYSICRLATQGWVAFQFDALMKKPPFNDLSERKKLLGKLNEISGVRFSEEVLEKRARVPLDKLITGESMERLKTTISWMIAQIKAESVT